MVASTSADVALQEEIRTMGQVIAESWIEEGYEKGELRASREWLLRMGRKRFGEPDAVTLAAIDAIADMDRFWRLGDQLDVAQSWQELLAAE